MKKKICLQWLYVSRVRSGVRGVPLVPVWGDVGRGFARKYMFRGYYPAKQIIYLKQSCKARIMFFFQSALNIFYKKKKKKNSSSKGHGLGLNIVKLIAELLNITVNITSEVNSGTAVTVSFFSSETKKQ